MPEDHAAFIEDHDDVETVGPSDSISCAGSSKRSKGVKRTKSKRSDSSGSKHGEKSEKVGRSLCQRSERVSKHDAASDSGSVETITPRRYRDRSIASLPLRGTTPSKMTADTWTIASYRT